VSKNLPSHTIFEIIKIKTFMPLAALQ